MHPYRMQQLIRERGMDEVVRARHRASLYQAIGRLERDGLIRVHGTAKAENRPERTVYALTNAGRQALHVWLHSMLAEPASEFPAFAAALSFMYLLEPDDARAELDRRVTALKAKQHRLDALLRDHSDSVPRLFMLELEYLKKSVDAELAWVRNVSADIEAGRLTWSASEIRETQRAAQGGEDV
jgi:DNA-binding PadR family transcriptional regulator